MVVGCSALTADVIVSAGSLELQHLPFLSFDQKFGVTPNEVEETLESGDYQSHLAIAYRLVVDNKHIEEKHAIEEFKYVGGFALGLVGHPCCLFLSSAGVELATFRFESAVLSTVPAP